MSREIKEETVERRDASYLSMQDAYDKLKVRSSISKFLCTLDITGQIICRIYFGVKSLFLCKAVEPIEKGHRLLLGYRKNHQSQT